MFTLQTSFKPLWLKGGGGGSNICIVEVTVNSKKENTQDFCPAVTPRIRPLDYEEKGRASKYGGIQVRIHTILKHHKAHKKLTKYLLICKKCKMIHGQGHKLSYR